MTLLRLLLAPRRGPRSTSLGGSQKPNRHLFLLFGVGRSWLRCQAVVEGALSSPG